MSGLYIAIACILSLIAAMEIGRRLLYCYNKLYWLAGTWFWFLLAWLVPGVTTLLVTKSAFNALVWTVLLALGQTFVMGLASWIIQRFRFRGRSVIRSWVLACISLTCGCFVIWNMSFFFGVPRELLSLAFRGKAPLIFTVHEYTSESWTDFTAQMKVEFAAGTLVRAVEGMPSTLRTMVVSFILGKIIPRVVLASPAPSKRTLITPSLTLPTWPISSRPYFFCTRRVQIGKDQWRSP